jgi:stage V sporulation protein SpoVS
MDTLHLSHPQNSAHELLEIMKQNVPKHIQWIGSDLSRVPNHSLVRARVFVQDNGFNLQMTPFIHPIRRGNEQKTMNFVVRDYPDDDWDMIDAPVTRYIEKQPHMCILQDFETISSDIDQKLRNLSEQDTVLGQKLPGTDKNRICVVKTLGPMLPLNQIVEIVGYFERPIEGESELLLMTPTIHCVEFKLIRVHDYVPESISFDVPNLRMNLIKALKTPLLGDVFAAEYMAAHMFYRM